MPIKAVIFDAYGTLFDVFSVGVLGEEIFPTKGTALAALWRDKQIEYTRLRTLSDQYRDFWNVTQDALEFACDSLGLPLTNTARDRLMQQYAQLTAFDENAAALTRLKDASLPLGILSNGTPDMLRSAVESAGLTRFFDHVLSIDPVRKFKTAPETYQLGPDAFGLPVSDILFVSSNCWDACGATWFGYQTLWLNRYAQPLERLGVTPNRIGSALTDVAVYVAEING